MGSFLNENIKTIRSDFKETFLTKTQFVIISLPYDNNLYCVDDNDDIREHQYIGILIEGDDERVNNNIETLVCGGFYLATGKITINRNNIAKISLCNKFNNSLTKSDKRIFRLIVPSIEKFFNGYENEVMLDDNEWDE